jgi:hypothetical protein
LGSKRGSIAKGPSSADNIFLHILPGEFETDIGQDVYLADEEEEEEEEEEEDPTRTPTSRETNQQRAQESKTHTSSYPLPHWACPLSY